MSDTRLMLITGLSGSGKSLVHDCLEDLGYDCVDNLPIRLLGKFFDLIEETAREVRRVAVVIDVRDRSFLTDFVRTYVGLRGERKVELLFLEASEAVLLRRFSETRRRHPLASDGRALPEALRLERQKLQTVRDLADHVIDTSSYTAHEVRDLVRRKFGAAQSADSLLVTFESFGFKHGIPRETDLLFDVRFLPNPYYVPELKEQTGLERAVTDYVLASPETTELLERLESFLRWVLPYYRKEGKSYLTISIGCTGGKHRSVVIAHELARRLDDGAVGYTVKHRDLERP